MRATTAALAVCAAAAAAGAFVLVSGGTMPAYVASHFDFAGRPNGLMPRDAYLRVMTGAVVGVPLVVLVASLLAMRTRRATPDDLPARGASSRHVAGFAIATTAFLAFVHWLVVQANATRPVRLSAPGLYGGLVVFGAFVFVWTMRLGRKQTR